MFFSGRSVCLIVFLVLPLLLLPLLLLLLLLSPSPVACADGLTMPPYSLPTPLPNNPFVGKRQHLIGGIQYVGFGSFFFSYLSSFFVFFFLLKR